MNEKTLSISFWDICLDNLPEGGFRHRRITPEDAKLCIDQARQEGNLLCLSHADLAAPYQKREAEKHEALCRVLGGHFGITLSLEEFFSKDETSDGLYFGNPLSLVQVAADSRLLVVTCNYVFAKEKTATEFPAFDIAADTVTFHLLEAV